MPSKYRSIAIVSLLVIGLIASSGVGTAEMEEPLEDGHLYWQGTTIVADGFAPNADEAELYTRSGDHVRNITLSGGALSIDTDDLQGRYYVTAPGVDQVTFEVVIQEVGVDASVTRTADGPPYVTAEVSISSNRAATVLHISGFESFAEYVEGDGERIDEDTIKIDGTNGEFTVELDHHAGDKETIKAEDIDTGVIGLEIFEVPPITHPPESVTTVSAERGGQYWAGDVLAFKSATTHDYYRVETISGDRVTKQQAAVDGRLYVNTTGYESNTYRVLHNESGEELTRFSISVQQLNASVANGALILESNREGYSATITISNESTDVTPQVLPNAENQTELVNSLGNKEELNLSTDGLAPGEYEIEIHADGDVNASTTFTVSKQTPTPTETPEVTSSPTETTTDAPTATDASPDTATSATPVTNTTGPGFSTSTAIVAILVVVGSMVAKAARD